MRPLDPLTRPVIDSRYSMAEDLRGHHWFDRDSEGPHNLADVEEMVARDPERLGEEFHVTGKPHLSYRVLFPERYALLLARARARSSVT